MRYFLLSLCLAVLTPISAQAGEGVPYGTITSTGADKDNSTTGVPFVISNHAKITIQCDADAYVLVSTLITVSASNGLKVKADVPWQTSVNDSLLTISSKSSGTVRVISVSGTVNCKVFARTGDE
jgi:hypothetical protein